MGDISNERSGRFRIRRRRFLQFGVGSIAGATILSNSPVATQVAGAQPVRFRFPDLTVQLRRRDDQLRLGFEFFNLRLDRDQSSLERRNRNQDAYVVVVFPPQHVMEQAAYEFDEEVQDGFDDDTDDPTETEEPLPPVPVGARLAGPSRLAFRVPAEVESIPFTVDALLAWENWAPNLVPVAHGLSTPPPDFEAPGQLRTALELPWWLILSPNSLGRWKHSAAPVTHGERTELWHTRLAGAGPSGEVIEGEGAEDAMKVRAVWMRDPDFPHYLAGDPMTPLPPPPFIPPDGEDFDSTKPGMPFRTALSPKDRFDLVICTADFAHNVTDESLLPPTSGWVPQAATVQRLMLSPMGGWLDAHGSWDPQQRDLVIGGPPVFLHSNTDLESWRHEATLGRDHYVRIVRRGFLFPFGFAASLVKVTERKFRTVDGRRRAYNFQRYFIIVRQRLVTYGGGNHPHEGREFPFSRLVCHTMITPNLDPPGGLSDDWVPVGPWGRTTAFVPRVGGAPFRFHLVGPDVLGRPHDLYAPVVFVGGQIVADDAAGHAVQALVEDYHDHFDVDSPERTIDLEGAKVAVAVLDGAPRGSTDLEIHQFTIGAEPTGGQTPAFFPTMAQSTVRLAAAEAVLGAGAAQPAVRFNAQYLEHGLDPTETPGEVFVELVATSSPASVDFGASQAGDRTGGVITPNLAVTALSRKAGPVGGSVDKYQGSAAEAAEFDPSQFFPVNASLLGDIRLGQVALPSAPGDEKAIKLMTSDLPGHVLTELVWLPALQDVGDLFLASRTDNGPDSTLVLKATIVTPKDGSHATTEVLGDLRNFRIQILPAGARFLVVTFDRLRFQSETGKKTDVDVEIAKVEFSGPLEFVNKLKDYLSFAGGGFEIELLPTHLDAGFAIPIPNISIGVFSISNIAFRAGTIIPFTGKPVRFRFGFSARDNMFTLQVMIFGGGGFFELEVGPDGVEALHLALEFGVTASIDFAVAAGSVKVMAGIYLAIGVETQVNPHGKLELSGYIIIEGKVRILLVASATVRLEGSFTYIPDLKKAVVRATVFVEVKVFGFGPTVEIEFERRFGGSADPTFGETLTQGDWDTYADAFAPIGV